VDAPTDTLSRLEKQLARWLEGAGKIVIMGIGNQMRRDDFVGMSVVRKLKRTASRNIHLVEAGEVPESYLGLVEEVQPTHILMVDAADMGELPGEVRLASPREIRGLSISTHTLPLSVVSEYLAKRTKAKIALLAIQPKVLDFGEGLSEELASVVDEVCMAITDAVKRSKRKKVRNPR